MNIRLFLGLTFASVLIGTGAADTDVSTVSLVLYTGQTIDEYTSVLLSDASALLSQIDSEKPSIIYIFGYTETLSSGSAPTVVSAYLERQDHNVIALDWEDIAAELYPIAAASLSDLAKAVAPVLDELVAAGLNSSTLHIVAHSLGAQLAGFIGRNTNFTVQRITGLDPAGPEFNFLIEYLSSTDAAFVDLIHTDAGAYGTASVEGTVDFFPNGGKRLQPGCPALVLIPLSDDDFCSHHRSYEYYAESLLTEDAFIGVECSTYTAFKWLLCRSNTKVVMGYATPTTASGKIYLQTNSESPYGKGVEGEIYEK